MTAADHGGDGHRDEVEDEKAEGETEYESRWRRRWPAPVSTCGMDFSTSEKNRTWVLTSRSGSSEELIGVRDRRVPASSMTGAGSMRWPPIFSAVGSAATTWPLCDRSARRPCCRGPDRIDHPEWSSPRRGGSRWPRRDSRLGRAQPTRCCSPGWKRGSTRATACRTRCSPTVLERATCHRRIPMHLSDLRR